MITERTTRTFLGILAMVLMLSNSACHSVGSAKRKDPELSAALRQVTLFAALTNAERTALESAAILRHCEAGERIIEQGQHLSKMYIPMQSKAEVRVDSNLVATLSEQSLIGEIEFLDTCPASAEVVIQKETPLIELDNAALTHLMKQNPRLGYTLIKEIAVIEAKRLRAMTND